jgi:MFS transporter, ACS family, tartrate transporter
MSNDDARSDCPLDESAVFRKVSWRLLPLLFLLYVVNLIDRSNIAIARLQMVNEQHVLDESAYALGAGIFYIGYLLFEVPSNLILLRIGARAWMARILVSWGLIATAMMLVTGPWSFACLRVLLGFAEAGFFPGIIYFLSDWFPARVRARAVAQFMTGGVIASLVGNPLSGWILESFDQVGGLSGWQWVFLVEGLPAILLGFITLTYLTDRPDQAGWLTAAERAWLAKQIENDSNQPAPSRSQSLVTALLDRRVWVLIAVYFTVAMGDNSYGFYVPTFLKGQFPEWSPLQIGLLAGAPSVVAMAGMIVVGWHSDRTGERRGHVAGSAFAAALGWLMLALVGGLGNPGAAWRWLFVVGVAVTFTGMKSMLPTFWTLPPTFLTGAACAGGIALINSVANLGGFLGPVIMGHVVEATGAFTAGYLVLAGVLLLGGLLVLSIGRPIGQGD